MDVFDIVTRGYIIDARLGRRRSRFVVGRSYSNVNSYESRNLHVVQILSAVTRVVLTQNGCIVLLSGPAEANRRMPAHVVMNRSGTDTMP